MAVATRALGVVFALVKGGFTLLAVGSWRVIPGGVGDAGG